MFKIKTILFLGICLTLTISKAQVNHFQVISLQMENNFSFPVFSSKKDSVSCKKINQFLQLSELELLHGYEKKNPFERVAIDPVNPIPGKEMINYKVQRNDSNLLSISFAQSYCGAGCTYWCSYYNFNPATGEVIYLKDLFTEKGYATFSQMVFEKRMASYSIEKKKLDSNQKTDFEAVPACYKTDPMRDYYISNDTLFLDRSLCFAKSLSTSEINPLTAIACKELKELLNEYGLKVMLNRKGYMKIYQSNQLPQLFEGTIGSHQIVFILNFLGKENISGIYFNLATGRNFQLRGKFIDNKLQFTEYNNINQEQGFIVGQFSGADIVGYHFNKDKKEPLGFQIRH